MAMVADLTESAFAVDFLLQPAQRLLHRLTFFKTYFCQADLTSSLSGLRRQPHFMNGFDLAQGRKLRARPTGCQRTTRAKIQSKLDSLPLDLCIELISVHLKNCPTVTCAHSAPQCHYRSPRPKPFPTTRISPPKKPATSETVCANLRCVPTSMPLGCRKTVLRRESPPAHPRCRNSRCIHSGPTPGAGRACLYRRRERPGPRLFHLPPAPTAPQPHHRGGRPHPKEPGTAAPGRGNLAQLTGHTARKTILP